MNQENFSKNAVECTETNPDETCHDKTQENYQIEQGLNNEKQTSENSSPNKMLPFENQRNSGDDVEIQHDLPKKRKRRSMKNVKRLHKKATLYMNKALELNVPKLTKAAIKVGNSIDKRKLTRREVIWFERLITSHMEKTS